MAVRQPPNVLLGSELTLLEDPLNDAFSTGFLSKDGRVHFFSIDAKRQIHHIEILGDYIPFREILGNIDANSKVTSIDAIEHPLGQLRVLVGDRQYFRVTPDRPWEEFKGNRCTRFVSVDAELFCAFVISGKEVSAPQRTDVTAGWFLLVPLVLTETVQASKLVLAQESHENWIVRAVLDPDDIRDADPDFVLEADNQGERLHLLYSASRGGGFFVLGASPGGSGGARSWGAKPELRYAEIEVKQWIKSTQSQSRKGFSSGDWISISSNIMPLLPPPFLQSWGTYYIPSWESLRPLNRHFDLNNENGEMTGVVLAPEGTTLQQGKNRLAIGKLDNLWLEIGIQQGRWSWDINVVAAEDLPNSSYNFGMYGPYTIQHDELGNSHVLLSHCYDKCFIDYYKKYNGKWSAPLIIGMKGSKDESRFLLIGSSRNIFAIWVNDKGKLVGKWIRYGG